MKITFSLPFIRTVRESPEVLFNFFKLSSERITEFGFVRKSFSPPSTDTSFCER
ncbi:MAG: hypothetical protein IPI04_18465 [Ignavibacteria bacterium]|nr:hypothetical protein [Ignavibacteria bacterium]